MKLKPAIDELFTSFFFRSNNNSSTKLLANSSSQNCIANRNLADVATLDGFALVVNGHSLVSSGDVRSSL